MKTCGDAGGVKIDGSPCPIDFGLSAGTGMCWHHDPAREEQRRRARSRGGHVAAERNRREPVDVPAAPETIEDAVRISSWATHAVLSGAIDVRVAREAANLLREFRSGVEKAKLEPEVKELRKAVALLKAKNKGGTR